ncbi:MAG: hypothetical protein ACRDF4_03160 [Rhabdochlamydiaceae bacterium]
MEKVNYTAMYDVDSKVHSGSKERLSATGWYLMDEFKIRGRVEHVGLPWSINPYDLVPDVAKTSDCYCLKMEINDTGNDLTSWLFEFKIAEIVKDHITMTPYIFWDKVSMKQNPEGQYVFQDRIVKSLQINFEPYEVRSDSSFNVGGCL